MYPHVGICRHYSVGAETPSTRRHATIQCPSEGGPPATPGNGGFGAFRQAGTPLAGEAGIPSPNPGDPWPPTIARTLYIMLEHVPGGGICRHYSVGAETPSTRRHATIQSPSEGGPPARPPRPPEMGVLELFGRRGPPRRGRPGPPAQTPGTPGLRQSLGHLALLSLLLCW